MNIHIIHIICIAIDIIVNFSLFGLSKLRLNNHSYAQVVKFTCSIVIGHEFTGG